MNVTWDNPVVAVDGFRILYRKFQLVYSGRWELVEVFESNKKFVRINLVEPDYPYIVVVRGIPKGQIFNQYNMGGGQHMSRPNSHIAQSFGGASPPI